MRERLPKMYILHGTANRSRIPEFPGNKAKLKIGRSEVPLYRRWLESERVWLILNQTF